jgi:RNA polymerase sigma-70 factor (ECF subfamily)
LIRYAAGVQPTRQTLLERLRDPRADRAWEDFYAMYWRVIVSYAQKLGLNEAGAQDVLQETMIALIRQMPTFQYNPQAGKFRNFLLTIVHRQTLSAKRRAARRGEVSFDAPVGGADGPTAANTLADESGPEPTSRMDQDWQESLFQEALRRVQADPRVKGETFAVFVEYVINQRPPDEVARQFNIKENAIYQIKNRMVKRLKDEVAVLRQEMGEPA